MGATEVTKIKKSKKKKRRDTSSTTATLPISNSSSSDDDDKKKAKGGKRNVNIKNVLAVVIVLLFVGFFVSGGFGSAADDPSNAVKVEVKVDSPPAMEKTETKKSKSKKKGDDKDGQDDDDDDAEDGENLAADVNFIESKHGNLGWSPTQGPLVVKRPPRECAVRRIAPQVTTPFFIASKKTNWKRRIYTCLRYGKQACPAMIEDDFEARRWKIKPTKKPLEDRILSTFVLTDSLTLQKLALSKPEVFNEIYTVNEGSTYLNALLGANGLDGSILEQFQARAQFSKEYGCSYNALKIQPPQYRFDVSGECGKLQRSFSKHENDNWVLMTFDEENQMKDSLVKGTKSMNDASFCSEHAVLSKAEESKKLASLVLPNPFHLESKLFDVRGYLLIASTMPFLVFFQQGYVRQADGTMLTSPYMFDGEDANDINLESFQDHLAKSKITGSHYVDTFLQSSMKQIALFVFHAARKQIKRRKGSYQLFSVDYVIDKTFRVHLTKTGGITKLDHSRRVDLTSMVSDMHDLVMELNEVPVAIEGMIKGDKYGQWELIFSEVAETCTKIVYNPCHEFIDFNDKDLVKQNKKVGKVQATLKRIENEQKRIVKKTEEKKKNTCRLHKIPYPSSKCNKLIESMDQEQFNKLFKEHEESWNPNEFRLPKPGEVFAHEIV